MALVPACESPVAPDSQPPERFGALTALINGRAWVSSYFPDSAIAFYGRSSGFLQLTGQEVRSGSWPTLQFFVRQGATAASYHIGDPSGEVHGEWFTERRENRPRALGGNLQAYFSTGATPDSLVIEELDLAGRRIRGRFGFAARELYGWQRVSIVGRFAGRVRVVDD